MIDDRASGDDRRREDGVPAGLRHLVDYLRPLPPGLVLVETDDLGRIGADVAWLARALAPAGVTVRRESVRVPDDVAVVLARAQGAPPQAVVSIEGIESTAVGDSPDRWAAVRSLNLRRELLREIAAPLVLWLPASFAASFLRHAPDFADWRRLTIRVGAKVGTERRNVQPATAEDLATRLPGVSARGVRDGLRTPRRLRILVVLAEPWGELPVLQWGEWTELRRAVECVPGDILVERLVPPTAMRLRAALSPTAHAHGETPDVLHFIGHAGPDMLLLEDESGRRAEFAGDELVDALDAAQVPLVVLNACATGAASPDSIAGLVHRLVRGRCARAAVGHGESVDAAAAVRAAGTFYAEIVGGRSVAEAARQAGTELVGRGAEAFVVGGDDRICFPVAAGSPHFVSSTTVPHRISRPLRFYDRERAAGALADALLDPQRCGVVVAGPAGIGKSTLLAEVAHRLSWAFPGGVARATVRGFGASGSTRSAVASVGSALGVESPTAEALLARINAQPTLIVLDDLDEVSAEDTEWLAGIARAIARGSGSKIAASARCLLPALAEVQGVTYLPLQTGLDTPAAMRLVRDLAREARVAALGDDGGSAGRERQWLVERLGGHPLLLEIAVKGVARDRPWLDARALLDGLSGARTEKIEAVYRDQLRRADPGTGAVLSLLPFFPAGHFRPEAMKAALATSDDVDAAAATQAIDRACAAGLVAWDAAGERYVFHTTVGEFAGRTVPLDDEKASRVDAALAAWYAYQVSTLGAAESARLVDVEVGNIESLAHRFLEREGRGVRIPPVAGGLAFSVSSRLFQRSQFRALVPLLRAAVRATETAQDDKGTAWAARSLATVLIVQGGTDEARQLAERALSSAERAGDTAGVVEARRSLAALEKRAGNLAEARRLFREVLAESRGNGRNTQGTVHAQVELALLEHQLDNPREAKRLLAEAVVAADELEYEEGRAAARHALAMIAWRRKDISEARRLFQEALDIQTAAGNERGRAAALANLGEIEARDHPVRGRAMVVEALNTLRRIGAEPDARDTEAVLKALDVAATTRTPTGGTAE